MWISNLASRIRDSCLPSIWLQFFKFESRVLWVIRHPAVISHIPPGIQSPHVFSTLLVNRFCPPCAQCDFARGNFELYCVHHIKSCQCPQWGLRRMISLQETLEVPTYGATSEQGGYGLELIRQPLLWTEWEIKIFIGLFCYICNHQLLPKFQPSTTMESASLATWLGWIKFNWERSSPCFKNYLTENICIATAINQTYWKNSRSTAYVYRTENHIRWECIVHYRIFHIRFRKRQMKSKDNPNCI